MDTDTTKVNARRKRGGTWVLGLLAVWVLYEVAEHGWVPVFAVALFSSPFVALAWIRRDRWMSRVRGRATFGPRQ